MANIRSETKTIAKHSSVYMLGTVLSRIVGFLMIPLYTRFLTPADYGIMQLLVLTADIIGMVISVGIASSMYRFYFEYEGAAEKNEVISTAILSFGTIGLVSLAGVSLFSKNLSLGVLNSEHYYFYFLISFASLWFNTILEMGYNYLRIEKKSVQFILFSLLKLVAAVALNIYFVAVMKLGVLGILLSTLISTLALNFILTLPLLIRIKIRFSLHKAREMLKYGAPMIPTNLAAFIVHASDRFFIKHFTGLADTGLYSLGYRFGSLPNEFVAAPFMQIWEVRFLEARKEKNAGELFGQLFTYLCCLLFLTGLLISALIKDTLMIMSSPAYWTAWKVVPVIVIAYIIFSFQYFFNMGIYFEKKTHYLAYINMSNAGLNIGLNFALIPSFGMWGAALATLFCFIYKVVLTYFVSNRLFKIHIEALRIGKIFLVAGILYILSWIVNFQSVYVNIMVKFLVVCLFPFGLSFVRFFTDEEKYLLRHYLRKGRIAALQFVTK